MCIYQIIRYGFSSNTESLLLVSEQHGLQCRSEWQAGLMFWSWPHRQNKLFCIPSCLIHQQTSSLLFQSFCDSWRFACHETPNIESGAISSNNNVWILDIWPNSIHHYVGDETIQLLYIFNAEFYAHQCVLYWTVNLLSLISSLCWRFGREIMLFAKILVCTSQISITFTNN